MKRLLTYSVVLLSFNLATSLKLVGQENDPNAEVKEMNLNDDIIATLCHIAHKGEASVNGLSAMFDFWILLEEKDPEEMTQKEMIPLLRKLWDTKYSKCYCDWSNATPGTLDYVALYASRRDWVMKLYNPKIIGANPNRIRQYSIIRKGTIVDMLIDLSAPDSNDFNINDDEGFRQDIIGYANTLRRYGAKSINDMTPEEIQQNSK